MRPTLALLVIILAATALASVAGAQPTELPPYYVSVDRVGYRLVASPNEEPDGSIFINYAVLDQRLEPIGASTTDWALYARLKPDRWEGAVSMVYNLPVIVYNFTITNTTVVTYSGLDVNGNPASGLQEFTLLPGNRVLYLYSSGGDSILEFALDIQFAQSLVYSVELTIAKYELDPATRTYSMVELDTVSASGTLARPDVYLTINLTVYPTFYTYTLQSGTSTIIFGWAGQIDVYCKTSNDCAPATATYSIAYTTVEAGSAPTLETVAGLVRSVEGWMIWAGVGLYRYTSDTAEAEIIPHPDYPSDYVLITNINSYSTINSASITYLVGWQLNNLQVYNAVADPRAILYAFENGTLDGYNPGISIIQPQWSTDVARFTVLYGIAIGISLLMTHFARENLVGRIVFALLSIGLSLAVGVVDWRGGLIALIALILTMLIYLRGGVGED